MFRRDVGRLLRVRKAWIIVIGVLVTPALYAWFNINAFWDPYANTGNIRVAVVNLDEGGTSDLTGAVDVGAQVEEQLSENRQLGWELRSEDDAQQRLRRGEVYAVIVIPAEFSEDLLSITTGTFRQPALRYEVNEKASAITPKITDVGASELDKKITDAFKEQVALAATEALKSGGDAAELRLLNVKNRSMNAFAEATQTLASARGNVAGLQSGLVSAREDLSSARRTLADVGTTLGDLQTSVAALPSVLAETQREVLAFSDATTTAFVAGTTSLAEASSSASTSVTRLTQALDQAGMRIDGAHKDVASVLAANEEAITGLQTLADRTDLPPETAQRVNEIIASLRERNATDQRLLSELKDLRTHVGDTAHAVERSAGALDKAVQDTRAAASSLRAALAQTVPTLTGAMSQLSSSVGALSVALGAQKGLLEQADRLLAGLDGQLVSASAALGAFDADLANAENGVRTARTDVLALGAASEWGALRTLTGLDAEKIASFIASPVEVAENAVFPIHAYGSAMAALFTNLSLWIGAFVLMVIFKVEVDTDGVEGITVRQAYFGRFLLFAVLAAAQAAIVCIGNLVIGVQTVSALAFVGTGALIALAYVSIVYALSAAFGHVGRGLCVLLVIMQIPGASGLYPIELMPGFFRAIYPLLPFSYGIDAMRETIAGFYGGHYWRFLGVLALFVLLSFLVGLVLRRRLASFTLLFNRQIAATHLLIGEKVQVTGRGYRLADVIRALSGRAEHADDLDRRARSFARRYPMLLRMILLAGLIGVVVLGVAAWALPGAKAVLLALWSLWCLLVMGLLVVIEYVRHSLDRAQDVSEADDADLPRLAMAGAPGQPTRRSRRSGVLGGGPRAADGAPAEPNDTLRAVAEPGQVASTDRDAVVSEPPRTAPVDGDRPDHEESVDDAHEVLARWFADGGPTDELPASGSSAPEEPETDAVEADAAEEEAAEPEEPGPEEATEQEEPERERDGGRTEDGGGRA